MSTYKWLIIFGMFSAVLNIVVASYQDKMFWKFFFSFGIVYSVFYFVYYMIQLFK